MSDQADLERRFTEIRFPNEPPMRSEPTDDVRRGIGRLWRRRVMGWTTGAAALAGVATGAVMLVPTQFGTDSPMMGTLPVGGLPSERTTPTTPQPDADRSTSASTPKATSDSTVPPSDTATPDVGSGDHAGPGFPDTRKLLLDTAVEHLDPRREHLPKASTGASTGGSNGMSEVGTKLGWQVLGESGTGMVRVLVSTPTDEPWDKDALGSVGWKVGCGEDMSNCTPRTIPGTTRRAWVAAADSDQDLEFGVLYERENGSLVGIGVYSLFGNSSLDAVPSMDIDLQQAFDFVTDPDLRVYPEELDS